LHWVADVSGIAPAHLMLMLMLTLMSMQRDDALLLSLTNSLAIVIQLLLS